MNNTFADIKQDMTNQLQDCNLEVNDNFDPLNQNVNDMETKIHANWSA